MGPVDNLELDDQLCFALYAASNAIVRAYRPLLDKIGLTYPQYLVMMALWERDDQSVHQIAERLQLPAHGLSPLLERMSRTGILTRERDPEDGRVVRVRLTQGGTRLRAAASSIQAAVVCQTSLTPAALDGMRDQLQDLVRVMEPRPHLVRR
ncbi:MAG: MarR family transcriptional regulator [Lapillicoccus sp.]